MTVLEEIDLVLTSSAIDKMFEIYTFFENRTEIYTFFENRSEIYTCILFENRTEISNIFSMVDGLTIRRIDNIMEGLHYFGIIKSFLSASARDVFCVLNKTEHKFLKTKTKSS